MLRETLLTQSLFPSVRDFGGIYGGVPSGGCRVASVADAVAGLAEAARSGRQVAVRGLGHSCNGHTVGDGGMQIDMAGLAGLETVADGYCDVLPGTLWADVVKATLPTGQVPPALPDYLGLTVGGTVSIGGLGGTSFREGQIADGLLAADVLTAEGAVLRCSADENTALFSLIKGGAGQFGVILRARIRLVAAPRTVDCVRLIYSDPAAMLADQSRLLGEDGLWHLGGWVLPLPQGWTPCIELAYPVDEETGTSRAGSFQPGPGNVPPATQHDRLPLAAFLHRLELQPGFPCDRGENAHAHPWFTAFLPEPAAPQFLARMLEALPPAEMGPAGVVEVYPVPAARLFPGPPEAAPPGALFMISAFPCQLDTSESAIAAALARNRRFHELAVALGGLGDPQASAVRLSAEDWRCQLGPQLAALGMAKAQFDSSRRFRSLPGLDAALEQALANGVVS